MKKSDIASFKKILLALKSKALAAPEAEVTPVSDIRGDDADINTQRMENDMQLKMSARNVAMIRDVNIALKRIDEGTYGLCLDCEEDIGVKRLEARPFTTLCISCKEQEEKEKATHSIKTASEE